MVKDGIEIDHDTAVKYLLEDGVDIETAPMDEESKRSLKKISRDRRCAEFVVTLESEVAEIIEQSASTTPWGSVNKSKLPASAYLWVEDPKRKSTWHLPYKEGGGGIDPETGTYRKAGPVNINALRAIAAAISGARTGVRMSVPAAVRSKINKLLKRHKIGRFREERMDRPTERELIEESSTKYLEGVEIDKEGHVVRNVAILRPTSGNCTFKGGKGRRYSAKALESTARLITGAKAYIDHPTKTEMKERGGIRSVKDMLGFYENGHVDSDGTVRADLHYLESQSDWFEPIVTQMGDKVGKSIHAYGPTHLDNESKEEIVEDIKILTSADLVTEPGSTRNLFEGGSAGEPEDEDLEEVEEEEILKIEDLSIKDLQEGNPTLLAKFKEQIEADQNRTGVVESLNTKIASLEEENKTLKHKVDEYDVAEKVREKKDLIDGLVTEAKLPKEAVTDVFLESLSTADGEDKIKSLIEDRKKLVGTGRKSGVRDMGDGTEIKEDDDVDTSGDVKGLAEAGGIKIEEV